MFLHGFHQRLVLGLAGAVRLQRRLYAVGPIAVRRTARFFPAEVMSFAKKNCSSRSIYWVQSSCSGTNSVNLLNWEVTILVANVMINHESLGLTIYKDTRIQQLVLSKYNHSTPQQTTTYPELHCVLHHCYTITCHYIGINNNKVVGYISRNGMERNGTERNGKKSRGTPEV